MSRPGPEQLSQEVGPMRERWQALAREAPMFYIASQRSDWTMAEFLEEGKGVVEAIMGTLEGRVRTGSALEVGCGLGRLLVHLSERFDSVDGIDIAPEMIGRAQRIGHLPDNVTLTVGSGADLAPYEDQRFDLVLSLLVFQHIPSQGVVADYLSEIARVLRPGGIAWLQFDTRPKGLVTTLLQALPDRMLPRSRRRYIRRYRLPAERPAEMADRAGLEVCEQRGEGTDLHVMVLRRPR